MVQSSGITLAAIRRALADRSGVPLPRPAVRGDRAAVALIFAGPDADLRLCFIQRATQPHDPWSGQMALPGGRTSLADASPMAVAVRETREEVGLELMPCQYLGALAEIPLVRSGRPTAGVVAPFVFYTGVEPARLTPDPAEVAAGYWIAVDDLRDPRYRVALERTAAGVTRRLPAIRCRRQLIWGMTHGMVTGLLDRVAP